MTKKVGYLFREKKEELQEEVKGAMKQHKHFESANAVYRCTRGNTTAIMPQQNRM
jgi:hypothetical protein